MRFAFAILLSLAAASAQMPAAPPPVAAAKTPTKTTEDEGAQKAHALLDKAIEALGGSAYLS